MSWEPLPMRKHGHLHYQVRGMSPWCEGDPYSRGHLEECGGAYLADALGAGGGQGRYLIALCTCHCHPYNHRQEVADAS